MNHETLAMSAKHKIIDFLETQKANIISHIDNGHKEYAKNLATLLTDMIESYEVFSTEEKKEINQELERLTKHC